MTDHQPVQRRFIEHFLKEGDIFIDVGAHTGQFAFIAQNIVGKYGLVIAIEPDPRNIKKLIEVRKKYYPPEFSPIILLQYAASNGEHVARMYTSKDNSALTSVYPRHDREDREFDVQTRTLDQLVGGALIQLLHGTNSAMLKIDVEGHELMVLLGARETLKLVDYVTVDYHPAFGVQRDTITEKLSAAGFGIWDIQDKDTRNEVYGIRI